MAGDVESSLFYNPSVAKTRGDSTPSSPFPTTEHNFPSLAGRTIRCTSAGSGGKRYGRIDSDIAISGDTLTLTNGLIDLVSRGFSADGESVNNPGNGPQYLAERKTAWAEN